MSSESYSSRTIPLFIPVDLTLSTFMCPTFHHECGITQHLSSLLTLLDLIERKSILERGEFKDILLVGPEADFCGRRVDATLKTIEHVDLSVRLSPW